MIFSLLSSLFSVSTWFVMPSDLSSSINGDSIFFSLVFLGVFTLALAETPLDEDDWKLCRFSAASPTIGEEDGIIFLCDVEEVGVICIFGADVAFIFMIVIDEGFASSEDGSQTELIPVVVIESEEVFEDNSGISFSL